MSADARIGELGLKLPPPPSPLGVYKPIVIVGRLAYLSGRIAKKLYATASSPWTGVINYIPGE